MTFIGDTQKSNFHSGMKIQVKNTQVWKALSGEGLREGQCLYGHFSLKSLDKIAGINIIHMDGRIDIKRAWGAPKL